MDFGFTIAAGVTLLGALAALTLRNLVHCGLCAALAFLGLAGLYVHLGAEFVGFAQILVYVGAVAIVIVFAILMTRHIDGGDEARFSSSWILGLGAGMLALGSLVVAVVNRAGPGVVPPKPVTTAKLIGQELMGRCVPPLEVTGLLLTAALIGAVLIAMKEKEGKP